MSNCENEEKKKHTIQQKNIDLLNKIEKKNKSIIEALKVFNDLSVFNEEK